MELKITQENKQFEKIQYEIFDSLTQFHKVNNLSSHFTTNHERRPMHGETGPQSYHSGEVVFSSKCLKCFIQIFK